MGAATYDVEIKTEPGDPEAKITFTVFHNGVKVHDNVDLKTGPSGGLHLQNHGRRANRAPGRGRAGEGLLGRCTSPAASASAFSAAFSCADLPSSGKPQAPRYVVKRLS